MKKLLAYFTILVLITSMMIVNAGLGMAAASIKVILNGQELRFDVDPIIIDGRTMVPIRGICEPLGLTLQWHPKNGTFVLLREKSVITHQVGTNIINIDGKTRIYDVKSLIVNGRTLVSLRMISEAVGLDVIWDHDTQTVNIASMSKPAKPVSEARIMGIVVGSYELRIGDDINEVQSRIGKAGRIDQVAADISAYVFNSDYDKFSLLLVKDKQVIGIYALGNNLKTLGGRENDFRYFKDGNDGDAVYAIACPSNIRFSFGHEDKDLIVIEKQIFDITNAFRAFHNKAILSFSEKASNVARLHCEDMANKDYFDHESLDGRSPWDRAKAGGINAFGENISAGNPDAISAMHGWINSSGHRSNILSSQFRGLGVGGAYSDSSTFRYYYTQLFL